MKQKKNLVIVQAYFMLTSLLFYTGSILAQCNGRYQSDLFSNINVTTVQYGSNKNLAGSTVNLMMDIYTPQGDVETNRPLIIFAHGGSFIGGSRTDPDVAYMAEELSKKGFVCASIDYRLSNSVLNLLQEKSIIETVFNAIQDGKAAIRFFKKDAATTNTYKINQEQIFFGGSSAGGIIALNLAYIDTITDLPEAGTSLWQSWVKSLGGLEGASGNPGYCSRINGTFSFAGGIADTSFINENEVPWYGCHSTNDPTVLYNCGSINGSPINLCGSGAIESRLNNLTIYSHLDSYSGADHPPYINSSSILRDNKDSLAKFLFNILDCNPNNLQLPKVKNCTNNPNVGINDSEYQSIDAKIFPNPFRNELKIELTNNPEDTFFQILNSLGETILQEKAKNKLNTIELNNLSAGIYTLVISNKEAKFIQKLIKYYP